MEITAVERPEVTDRDVLVSRDAIINMEKRARRRSQRAFPLFNHQFVAISDTEADTISVYKVINESMERYMTWNKLQAEPLVMLESKFVRQVRHVSSGKPLVYCNGLHCMQLIVCYANHYIELVEIFPQVR